MAKVVEWNRARRRRSRVWSLNEVKTIGLTDRPDPSTSGPVHNREPPFRRFTATHIRLVADVDEACGQMRYWPRARRPLPEQWSQRPVAARGGDFHSKFGETTLALRKADSVVVHARQGATQFHCSLPTDLLTVVYPEWRTRPPFGECEWRRPSVNQGTHRQTTPRTGVETTERPCSVTQGCGEIALSQWCPRDHDRPPARLSRGMRSVLHPNSRPVPAAQQRAPGGRVGCRVCPITQHGTLVLRGSTHRGQALAAGRQRAARVRNRHLDLWDEVFVCTEET